MKSKHILTSALLCLLLLASCSDSTDKPAADSSTGNGQTTETEAVKYIDNLPDDLDLNGYEVRVFTQANSFVVEADETADIINDQIYRRNSAVEERFNTTIKKVTYEGNAWEVFVSSVESTVMAGMDEYDIISSDNWVATPLTFSGMMYNLYDAPYLQLDQPWWAGDYINGMSYKDNLYWLAGPLDTTWVSTKVCNFVNLNLWNSLYDENIYDIVNEGKWTMDVLNEYATDVYQDLNGDGAVDRHDRLGYVAANDWCVERNAYACGIMVAPHNDEGVPTLAFIDNTELITRFWEKMYALESNPTFFPVNTSDGDTTGQMHEIFCEGNLLFADGYLRDTTTNLRGMEDDYGILPLPKLDETQKNYISVLADSVQIFGMPKTVSEDGFNAALVVMEAAAAEGYNTVIPAYYADALKNKYIRDEHSIEIINMLSENPMSDFGAQYLDLRFHSFMRYEISGTNIASAVTRKSKSFQKTLDKLLTALEESE